MSVRGRSPSPRPINGSDTEMAVDQPMRNGRHGSRSQSREKSPSGGDAGPRVVVVHNLTRNVLESHIRAIFGHYGKIKKVDFPTYKKTGQTRGKAAMEYFEANEAAKAVKHMHGGQLDGASDLFAAWAESAPTLVLVHGLALEAVRPSGGADRGQGPGRPAVLEVAALLDAAIMAPASAVDVVDSTVATTVADTEVVEAVTATDTAHPDVVAAEATRNLVRLPLPDALAEDLRAMNVVESGQGVEPTAAVLAVVHRVVAAVGLVADRTRAHDPVRTPGDRILLVLEGVLPGVGVARGVEAHLERGCAVAAEVLAAQKTPQCRLAPALAVAIDVVVAALDCHSIKTRARPFSCLGLQHTKCVKPLYD